MLRLNQSKKRYFWGCFMMKIWFDILIMYFLTTRVQEASKESKMKGKIFLTQDPLKSTFISTSRSKVRRFINWATVKRRILPKNHYHLSWQCVEMIKKKMQFHPLPSLLFMEMGEIAILQNFVKYCHTVNVILLPVISPK